MAFVYGLCDPQTHTIRYVGKTVYSIDARFDCHIGDALSFKCDFPSSRWIRKLAKDDVIPYVIELEKCETENEAFDLENEWILRLGKNNLLNCTYGGEGSSGYTHTEETKKKLRGRIASIETRRKQRIAKLGTILSDEHKRKISLSLRGKKKPSRTIEHRQRLSMSMVGKKSGMAGKCHSNKSIEKMRRAQLGKKQSQETIEKRLKTMSNIRKHGNAVMCIDDGITFMSCRLAAEHYNINEQAVSRVARGATKQTKSGLRFVFVEK